MQEQLEKTSFAHCLCQGSVMDLPSNAATAKKTFWFPGPHTAHAGVISVLHARLSSCSPFVSKQRELCRVHVLSHIPTGNLLSRPRGRKSSTFSANKRIPLGSVLAEEQRGQDSCKHSARRQSVPQQEHLPRTAVQFPLLSRRHCTLRAVSKLHLTQLPIST